MNKVLGIDTGTARVGLALSDDLGMMAHPLETVEVKKAGNVAKYITGIIAREKVTVVVIGLPRNMDGSNGPATAKAREFGEALRAAIGAAAAGCEIKYWDERMTSMAAQRALHESGLNVKKSRPVIDQVAAQMILQGWLDAQAMRAE